MRISDWGSNVCSSDLFGPDGTNANNLYDPVQVAKPTFNALVAGNLSDPNPANRTRLTSFFVSDTLGAFEEKVELTVGLRRQQIFYRAYDITVGGETSRYKESEIGRAHV